MSTFCDLHVHSAISDGRFSLAEVIASAEQANIGVLAVTDHDTSSDLSDLRLQTSISLVQGSEISTLYQDSSGENHVVHLLAWGFNYRHGKILDIFKKNNSPNLDLARREIREIELRKLLSFGIDLGTYDDLKGKWPDKKYLSRNHLADEAVRRGFASNSTIFLDKWIGNYGDRLAFVDQILPFVPMEEAVDAILSAGGICGLAHPLYYRLGDTETEKLVEKFKGLTGNFGALEALYGPYNEAQGGYVRDLAARHKLMLSAGSDFDGWNPEDSLGSHRFECSDIEPLLEALNIGKNDYAY